MALDKSKRKETTEFIANSVNEILPDGFNKERTLSFLNELTDIEFEEYIKKLGTEEERLSLIAPNGSKEKIELERNFQLAEKLGINFFQRIWMDTPDGKGKYLTPDKYMILKMPVRRQSQLLVKKIAIPEHNRTIDSLTGQPAGDSKGSRISYPELQTIASLGLNNTLSEFMKFRGGDLRGFSAMNTSIKRTGGVSIRAIAPLSGKVKSTEALSAFLTGMHLKNNL